MQHVLAGNEAGTFSPQIWLDELAGGCRGKRGQASLSLCRMDGAGPVLGVSCGRRGVKGCPCFFASPKRCYLTFITYLKSPSPPFLLLHTLVRVL